MSIDTNYSPTMQPAVAGHIANMAPKTMLSRIAEAEVAFGAAVKNGAADRSCAPISADADVIKGVAARENSGAVPTPTSFKQYETARVMEEGAIWVEVSEAVATSDPVKFDPATQKFNKTTGASFPNAEFETSSTGAGLVVLFIK